MSRFYSRVLTLEIDSGERGIKTVWDEL